MSYVIFDVLYRDGEDLRGLAFEERRERLEVLARARDAQVQVVFKRLETAPALNTLRQLGSRGGGGLLAQGYLLDMPRATLLAEQPSSGAEDKEENVSGGFSFPPATL